MEVPGVSCHDVQFKWETEVKYVHMLKTPRIKQNSLLVNHWNQIYLQIRDLLYQNKNVVLTVFNGELIHCDVYLFKEGTFY